MTTTKALTTGLVDHLNDNTPDESIAVVDARTRAEIALPTLAVGVTASKAFNESLHMVDRLEVEIILRAHAGEDDDATDESWCDQIESKLNDISVILAALNVGALKVYDWTYNGSTQEWSDSVLETRFEAEAICARI